MDYKDNLNHLKGRKGAINHINYILCPIEVPTLSSNLRESAMKKLPRRVVKGKPRNTVTRDITSKDKVATNLTQPTLLTKPPVLTQPTILSFITKGIKRKGEQQLTSNCPPKIHLIRKIEPMSRRAKATYIKMVKDIITDILKNVCPTPISPIFAHLVSYKNLLKVSKKPIELRKVQKQP